MESFALEFLMELLLFKKGGGRNLKRPIFRKFETSNTY